MGTAQTPNRKESESCKISQAWVFDSCHRITPNLEKVGEKKKVKVLSSRMEVEQGDRTVGKLPKKPRQVKTAIRDL